MKKAFVDQVLLGLVLLVGVIFLVGTVTDENMATNKVFSLKEISSNTTRILAKHYMYNDSIEEAEEVANNLLTTTKLGQDILDQDVITYIWTDTTADGEPNVVTSIIEGYSQSNFWYKFMNKTSFNLSRIDSSSYVTKDESTFILINIKFGGSNAGYHNMIGTYELDEDGCIQNTSLLLVNKEDHEIGDKLGSYENLDTRFFLIPDGYDHFGNRSATLASSLSITGCEGDTPSITIDGISDATDVYFQDTFFNPDNGYDHMHEIGKSYFDDYETFINTPISTCTRYRSNGSCRQYTSSDPTWEDWEIYAADNNINYGEDPNDEYIITMEDLPNGGDKDFNDINLDTTKVRIPGSINTNDIEGDEI